MKHWKPPEQLFMQNAGYSTMSGPRIIVLPVVLVLAVNLLGDGLRGRAQPRVVQGLRQEDVRFRAPCSP